VEESILEHGCRDPLVVWNGTLLDGHNRYEICRRHGLNYETVDMHFDSQEAARVWMRKNQMGRRNLTAAWRIELELGNKEDLAKIGRARKVESGEQTGRGNKKVLSHIDKTFEPKHDTRKEIAKAAGTSTGMVGMAEQVRKKSPELWEKAKQGEVTVGAAYAEIKKEEKKAERQAMIQRQRDDIEQGKVQLPEGVFEVVAMDPPWNYGREYDPDSSRVANPYPEMTQQELMALEPPFADDCVLFLWTTHQFIWDAKALMDHWGFNYKATAVWDKERIGMGAWLRMQCEFILVGIKGKPHWNNTTWRDIIREPRREHSRKPDAFYEMVTDITAGRRLEYFSRERRDGWEVLGNDIEKF
jgi:N6-adenosine-specific RNA methylase IME4